MLVYVTCFSYHLSRVNPGHDPPPVSSSVDCIEPLLSSTRGRAQFVLGGCAEPTNPYAQRCTTQVSRLLPFVHSDDNIYISLLVSMLYICICAGWVRRAYESIRTAMHRAGKQLITVRTSAYTPLSDDILSIYIYICGC